MINFLNYVKYKISFKNLNKNNTKKFKGNQQKIYSKL